MRFTTAPISCAARIMFAAMGMVNDQFLQSVRRQTHRGLEGRAIAGFWTGGDCYGYSSVSEVNPTDVENPRKTLIVDDEKATIVRRIFSEFASGFGLKRIAIGLNNDCVQSPRGANKIGNG
jgi:site-specific DNA recombinase